VTQVPIAEAIKVAPNPSAEGAFIATVRCPYCSKKHQHGIPSADDTGGHRAPHCVEPRINRGYTIFVPSEVWKP